MRRLSILLALPIVALALLVGACGSSSDSGSSGSGGSSSSSGSSGSAGSKNMIQKIPSASGKTITVGSKNFTEQYILGEIYAQSLQAAGFTVKKQLNLGSELIAYKALKAGKIDAYPEYTGTALTSFFGVKTADVPRDKTKAYDDAKAGFAKNGITAYPPTPFENTFRLGMTKKTAAANGNPTKISDLKPNASKLSINGFPECKQRVDCLIGVQQTYGFKFKKFVASEQKYQTLDSGAADVAFVFTTDGDLASGKYVVLDDDKKFFPPYNVTFAVRNQVAKELGSDGAKLIASVQSQLTEKVMQELNARVDVDKQKPADVAREYLQAAGYIPKS